MSLNSATIPDEIDSDICYLAGIISGDGCISRKYTIQICDGHEINLKYVQDLFTKVFKVRSKIKQEEPNKWNSYINSKNLVEYFNTKFQIPIGNKSDIICVPDIIRSGSLKVKKSYIQGWLDCEACMENWPKPHSKRNYYRLRFCCKSLDVISWINHELNKLGIVVSKNWYSSKVFRFQVGKMHSIEKFYREIGFRYPTKIRSEILTAAKVET